jgi:type II secretory ATPase GspE/PulE/Tfp pilus assembly ATPase PilB-like protein
VPELIVRRDDMNPFVNPKKRDISLPHGCKDLADVLTHPRASKSPIRRFINLVLMQAQQDCATELVFGVPPSDADGTPIRYKVEGRWYDMSPFPSHIRRRVVSELRRMAGLAKATFPLDGVLAVRLSGAQLAWRLRISAPDAECVLTTADV